MNSYFPIALSLSRRKCVVIGGGSVAARRIPQLLECGAEVVVCADEFCPEIKELAGSGNIELTGQPFVPEQLDGAYLVIAATDNPEVNSEVVSEARVRGALCCNVESPEDGDFIVPSTVRRGELLISITTCGASPSLAGRISDDLK